MYIHAAPVPENPRLKSLSLEGQPLGFALFPAPLPAGNYPIGLGFCPPADSFTAFVLAVPGTSPAEPYFLAPALTASPEAHPLAIILGKGFNADGITLTGGRVLFNGLLWRFGQVAETEVLILIVE